MIKQEWNERLNLIEFVNNGEICINDSYNISLLLLKFKLKWTQLLWVIISPHLVFMKYNTKCYRISVTNMQYIKQNCIAPCKCIILTTVLNHKTVSDWLYTI